MAFSNIDVSNFLIQNIPMAVRRTVEKRKLHVLPQVSKSVLSRPPAIQRIKNKLRARTRDPRLADWADVLLRNASDSVFEDYSVDDLAARVEESFAVVRRRKSVCDIVVKGPRLYVLQDDQLFLVRSIRALMHQEEIPIRMLLHPIISARRERQGNLAEFSERGEDEHEAGFESFILLEAASDLPQTVVDRVERLMAGIRAAVGEFEIMRAKLTEAIADLEAAARFIPPDELEEAIEYFRWLGEGNFVLLGYREYSFVRKGAKPAAVVRSDSGRGILKDASASRFKKPAPLDRLGKRSAEALKSDNILNMSKTNRINAIYRGGRLDYIGLKILDQNGRVVGERRFIGHYSDRANYTSKIHVPILRRKYDRIRQAFRAARGSYDDKEIVRHFTKQQVDTLFLTSVGDLIAEFELAMRELDPDEVRVAIRYDHVRRGLAVTLVMSQERYRPSMREAVENAVTSVIETTHVDTRIIADSSEGGIVRLLFFFSSEEDNHPIEELKKRVLAAVETWLERFEAILRERHGGKAAELFERYASAFDETYQVIVAPELAAFDVEDIEALEDRLLIRWGRANPGIATSYLKIFSPHRKLFISEITPILVNHGFIVDEENAFVLQLASHPRHEHVYLHIFRLKTLSGGVIGNDPLGVAVAANILNVYEHRVEDDRLAELILSACRTARQVDLLRAIRNYIWQIGAVPVRKESINGALLGHPDAVTLFIEAFEARFHPERRENFTSAMEKYRDYVAGVSSIDEDRVLRLFGNVVEATVRTNYFMTHDDHPFKNELSPIALKIDSAKITKMPDPRPWREIYVYGGAEFEGCHLRFGPVARGGLRWSERPDDFRTEILGLMKTQVTKNAQIVPTGAKGGFVMKRLPRDRAASFEAVRRGYAIFVSSLLDIQDNLVRGKGKKPDRIERSASVVAYDEDDPYFVVAADKGTATFSDLANSIALHYGFWLGDAFASGGSNGYDHKKEGITARGAWISGERHFRELGKNLKKDSITAVGVGDMSGDVFGNGMLLSKNLKLIAAFDHRDIFLDPDPDVAAAFAERRRLFRLPRSSWQDYSSAAISAGGGVYSRTVKLIPVSKEAAKALGISAGPLDPDSLIRAILRAQVDLFYNGGIGTYVKASHEADSEVGDPQNDQHRVDADELRCAVVVEGGNLGFTQAGRIEYALRGGHIYTDAIDNAAGVDLSDHEVNLKILIDSAGKYSESGRTRLLKKYKAGALADVLHDNYMQTLGVSLDELRSREQLGLFARMIAEWEKKGLLVRELEQIPGADEIRDRMLEKKSLVRPELAVLLAYAKIDFKSRVLESPLVTRPDMYPHSDLYFASEVRKDFSRGIRNFRLGREVMATVLANRIVNLHGGTILYHLTTDLGLAASRVVEAILGAHQILGVEQIVEDLFKLDDRLSTETQYAELLRIDRAVRFAAQWLVRNIRDLRARMADGLPEYGRLCERFLPLAKEFAPEGSQEDFEEGCRRRAEAGIPADLARRLAFLEYTTTPLDVVYLAAQKKISLSRSAAAIYGVGRRLRMNFLFDQIGELQPKNEWDRLAAENVIGELRRSRRRIAKRVEDLGTTPEEHLKRNFRTVRAIESSIARIEAEQSQELSPYIVVANQIHNLAAL